MATAAAKKPRIEKDQFTPDGVRMFNPTKEHGTVYSDGFIEVRFIQEYEGRPVHYRGDHLPVGYKPGEPLPPAIDEVQEENAQLKARIAQLEDSNKRTQELLERLVAQTAPKASTPAPAVPASPPEASVKAESSLSAGKPAKK